MDFPASKGPIKNITTLKTITSNLRFLQFYNNVVKINTYFVHLTTPMQENPSKFIS